MDFVNTVGGRARSRVVRDKIGSYDALLRWSRLAGTLDAKTARVLGNLALREPQGAAAAVRRASILREALYRLFRSRGRGVAADLETVRAEVTLARANQYLEMRGGHFRWTFPASLESPDRVLWPVALSAAELLMSEDLAQLRECGGAGCGWLFLDTSRNHSRRWCDMQDCGNRAKVRRFRQKASAD